MDNPTHLSLEHFIRTRQYIKNLLKNWAGGGGGGEADG